MSAAISNEQLHELAVEIYNGLGRLLTSLDEISATTKLINLELSSHRHLPWVEAPRCHGGAP